MNLMSQELLLYTIWGNTLKTYILFASFIAAGIAAVRIFRFIVFKKIKRFSEKTQAEIDDIAVESFRRNIIPVMYFSIFYFATDILSLSHLSEKWIRYIFLVSIAFFVTRFCIAFSVYIAGKFWLANRDDEGKRSISLLLNTIIRILIWSVALLILLDNLGVRISGLVAGLGVGGVAIAFAAQSILRDIFNYFTIFFDHPFEIGDFLVIDEFAGVVEHIGIKTTRLRSLGGEQLIFANTDLTGSRVRNYKTMHERRIVFNFGVTYNTPPGKMKKISSVIEEIITGTEGVRFDRGHFKKFGDSSLDFEAVYYVLSGDYKKYMDIQEEINLKLMNSLNKLKVEFAYPTRTLYINK